MRIAEQRDRAAQYRVPANEATTETMRKRLLDLARQCDRGKGPEETDVRGSIMEMEAAREIIIEKLRDAIIAARRRKRRAAIAEAIVKLEVAASREH